MNVPTSIYGIQLRAVAYAAGAALLLLVLGFAGCQHQRAENEAVKRLAAESQRDEAIAANETNQLTIARLHTALNAWAAIGLTPDEVAALLKDAAAALAESKQALKSAMAAKEHDRANPDCAALLSANLSRACPGIASVLRDAEGGGAHGNGRSTGPGAEAVAQGNHR